MKIRLNPIYSFNNFKFRKFTHLHKEDKIKGNKDFKNYNYSKIKIFYFKWKKEKTKNKIIIKYTI